MCVGMLTHLENDCELEPTVYMRRARNSTENSFSNGVGVVSATTDPSGWLGHMLFSLSVTWHKNLLRLFLILTFPFKILSEIEWPSNVECRPKAWRGWEVYKSVWILDLTGAFDRAWRGDKWGMGTNWGNASAHYAPPKYLQLGHLYIYYLTPMRPQESCCYHL